MKTKPKRRPKAGKGTLLGSRTIASLQELVDGLKSGAPLETFCTVRTFRAPFPRRYTAQKLKQLRAKLNLSQAAFASVLAVPVRTLQEWEQGRRVPEPVACRLMDTISVHGLATVVPKPKRLSRSGLIGSAKRISGHAATEKLSKTA